MDIEHYNKILSDTKLKRKIECYCDIIFVEPRYDLKRLGIESNESLFIFATDNSGGLFLASKKNSYTKSTIFYINFEGEFEKIATSFKDFILTIVLIPYWTDILKFSSDGKLKEMLKSNEYLKKEWLEDFPNKKEIEQKILSGLNLNHKDDIYMIKSLYLTINEDDCNSQLFLSQGLNKINKTFSPKDNPMWK